MKNNIGYVFKDKKYKINLGGYMINKIFIILTIFVLLYLKLILRNCIWNIFPKYQ